jgi:hypothetical protein
MARDRLRRIDRYGDAFGDQNPLAFLSPTLSAHLLGGLARLRPNGVGPEVVRMSNSVGLRNARTFA